MTNPDPHQTTEQPQQEASSPAPIITQPPAPQSFQKAEREGETQAPEQRSGTRQRTRRRNTSQTRLTRRRAKQREYHARLLRQGRLAQAAQYRLLHADAWHADAPAPALAGGGGGRAAPTPETGRNPPHLPNYSRKEVYASGYAVELAPELRNDIIALIDRRVKEILAAKEEVRPVVVEEAPVIYQKEWKPVVWHEDPSGTVEAEVVGAPKNVRMRLISVSGVEGVQQMWVLPGMPPMVGFRVAVRPSEVEHEQGYVLVGEYGRKGDRIT